MAAGGLPIVTPLARIRLPTISQLQAAINKQSLIDKRRKLGSDFTFFGECLHSYVSISMPVHISKERQAPDSANL